jgi:chemotaxis regulatin CheY-phosphate phosphatase CheZ
MSKSLFSFSVDKCSKYWPDTTGQIIKFGSIVVQNIEEEIVSALDGLTVRKFKAIN